ncbi:MAG: sulfite exporter TauE/SafE family protein [Pseudomonadota bacterium]
MNYYSPGALFLVGLLSSVHCVAMCGGIMGALSSQLSQEVRQSRARTLMYLLSYNGGRILSYVLIGIVLGAVGGFLLEQSLWSGGHAVFRVLGAAVMMAMGLYLAGLWPSFRKVEVIGRPVWRKLSPLAQRLTPVRSPAAALAYGAVWGWLPCGLVYAVALYAASLASPTESGVAMLAFGLGTMPSLVAVGWLFQPILRLTRSPRFRLLGGLSICLLAAMSLFFSPHQAHSLMGTEAPQPASENQESSGAHSHHGH